MHSTSTTARLLLGGLLLTFALACGDSSGGDSSAGTSNGADAGADTSPMDTGGGDDTTETEDTAVADTTEDTAVADTTPDAVEDTDEGDSGTFPNQPGGNPLVPEQAAYPFPSDFYLTEDATTPTGRRIEIPVEVLPEGLRSGADLFNGIDGFSLIPLLLAYLPGGVDIATLPSPTDHGESVADDSTVFLVEEGTLERIPLLAEIDANADEPTEAALLIRPLVALKPNTGYAVILREGLRAIDGAAHVANDAFLALRDETPTEDPTVEAQRDDFALVHAAIDALPLEREQVILAWSFHTRSDERVTGPLLAAQRAANEAPVGTYTITENNKDDTNRQVRGTFMAPNFTDPDTGAIVWDPDSGEITQFGEREVAFVMTIPNTVDEPRPVIMYGHGFLGDAIQATRGRFNRFCRENRFSTVATNFGFHEGIVDPLTGALAGEAHEFNVITSEVIQAFANTTHLTRFVKERFADDFSEEGDAGEFSPFDPTRVHYLGISNGGTFGYVQAATSPQVDRAVILVGGGGLIHFLERATQWTGFQFVFETLYPNPLELQLFFSVAQHQLDLVDSMSFARRMVNNRYPGLQPLKASVHMAVHDSQVRNLVTEWVVRSAGIPMVVPSSKDVYGLETLNATPSAPPETMSAFYVYDEMVEPAPITNQPPPEDNDTHGTVRDLMGYRTHAGTFLEEGTFVMVCDGPCDPE